MVVLNLPKDEGISKFSASWEKSDPALFMKNVVLTDELVVGIHGLLSRPRVRDRCTGKKRCYRPSLCQIGFYKP